MTKGVPEIFATEENTLELLALLGSNAEEVRLETIYETDHGLVSNFCRATQTEIDKKSSLIVIETGEKSW